MGTEATGKNCKNGIFLQAESWSRGKEQIPGAGELFPPVNRVCSSNFAREKLALAATARKKFVKSRLIQRKKKIWLSLQLFILGPPEEKYTKSQPNSHPYPLLSFQYHAEIRIHRTRLTKNSDISGSSRGDPPDSSLPAALC